MATVEDQLISITAQLTALQTAVAAIAVPAVPVVDLTPVTTAVAGVQTTANAILVQLEPTVVAPTA